MLLDAASILEPTATGATLVIPLTSSDPHRRRFVDQRPSHGRGDPLPEEGIPARELLARLKRAQQLPPEQREPIDLGQLGATCPCCGRIYGVRTYLSRHMQDEHGLDTRAIAFMFELSPPTDKPLPLAAANALAAKHQYLAAQFVSRHLGTGIDRDDLESLAGEGLTLASRNHVASKGAFQSFCWRQMRWCLLNHLKGLRRRQERGVGVLADDAGQLACQRDPNAADPFARAATADDVDQLRAALAEMDERSSMILRWRYSDGDTLADIADRLSGDRATIETALAKAKEELRRRMRRLAAEQMNAARASCQTGPENIPEPAQVRLGAPSGNFTPVAALVPGLLVRGLRSVVKRAEHPYQLDIGSGVPSLSAGIFSCAPRSRLPIRCGSWENN